MTKTQSPARRDWAIKWGSVITMALVIAYSTHPLLTVVLQLADGTTQQVGANFMTLMLGGLAVVFAAAVFALIPQENAGLRIEKGCRWSGTLLWLTIPVMILITWLTARAENGADHGGATAAFFMLMIFGSYCAIIGSIFLGVAMFMRRRRIATTA